VKRGWAIVTRVELGLGTGVQRCMCYSKEGTEEVGGGGATGKSAESRGQTDETKGKGLDWLGGWVSYQGCSTVVRRLRGPISQFSSSSPRCE
jgi:hypothetical protein